MEKRMPLERYVLVCAYLGESGVQISTKF